MLCLHSENTDLYDLEGVLQSFLFSSFLGNRPLSSFKKQGQVQNLSCENEFYLHNNKNYFHEEGFALGRVLKQRLAASRKWPIFLYFI